MKKDNTLLWVGVGAAVVVASILFIVLRPKGDKKRKEEKKGDSDLQLQGESIVVGDSKIDLSKFKIDFDKIANALAQPVSKEKKYELLQQSGVSTQTISLIQKADEAEKKKSLEKSLKTFQQRERDAQFERLTGIKPRSFSVSTSIGG